MKNLLSSGCKISFNIFLDREIHPLMKRIKKNIDYFILGTKKSEELRDV